MVRDIFDTTSVAGLKGWMGVGHGTSMILLGVQSEFMSRSGETSPA